MWVMFGSTERRCMRIEIERDLRGRFVRRAVLIRWVASLRWFDWQRRGMRRLISVSCFGLRLTCSVLLEEQEEDEQDDKRSERGFMGMEERD